MYASIYNNGRKIYLSENYENISIIECKTKCIVLFTITENSVKSLYINHINKDKLNSSDNILFSDEFSFLFYSDIKNDFIVKESENFVSIIYTDLDDKYNNIIIDKNLILSDSGLTFNLYKSFDIFSYKYYNETTKILDYRIYEKDGLYSDIYYYEDGYIKCDLSYKLNFQQEERKKNIVLDFGKIKSNNTTTIDCYFEENIQLPIRTFLNVNNITTEILDYYVTYDTVNYIYTFFVKDPIIGFEYDNCNLFVFDNYIIENEFIYSPSGVDIYKDNRNLFNNSDTYELISIDTAKNKSLLINYKVKNSVDVYNLLCYNKYIMYTDDNSIFDEDGLVEYNIKILSYILFYDDGVTPRIETNYYINSYFTENDSIITYGLLHNGEKYALCYNTYGLSIVNGIVYYTNYRINDTDNIVSHYNISSYIRTSLIIDEDFSINKQISDINIHTKKFSKIWIYSSTFLSIFNTIDMSYYVNYFNSIEYIYVSESLVCVNNTTTNLLKYKIIEDIDLNKNMILVKMLPFLPEYLRENNRVKEIVNVFEKIHNGNYQYDTELYNNVNVFLGLKSLYDNDNYMIEMFEFDPKLYFYDKKTSFGLNPILSVINQYLESDLKELDDDILLYTLKNYGLDFLYDIDYLSTFIPLPYYDDGKLKNKLVQTDESRDKISKTGDVTNYKNNLVYDIKSDVKDIFNTLIKFSKNESSKFYFELILGLFGLNHEIDLSIKTGNNFVDIKNLTFLGDIVENKLYFKYDNFLVDNLTTVTRSLDLLYKIINNYLPINFTYCGVVIPKKLSFTKNNKIYTSITVKKTITEI